MKKLTAFFITLVMVFSITVPALSADPKAYFVAAQAVTKAVLDKEFKRLETTDPSIKIMEELLKSAYRQKVSVSINDMNVYGDNVSGIKYGADVKVDPKTSKTLSAFDYLIPAKITGAKKDMDLDLNVYSDKEIVAFNLPAVSKDYYYFDYTKAAGDISSTPIGEILGSSGMELSMLMSVFTSIPKSLDASQAKKYENIYKPYQKLIKDAFLDGTFAFESAEHVDYPGYPELLKKTSTTLSAEQIDTLCDKIAHQIRSDKTLLELFSLGTSYLTGMGYTTENIIEELAVAVEDIDYPGNIVYSILTDKESRILTNEFSMNMDGEQILAVRLSTMGKTYLLNNIELAVEVPGSDDNVLGYKITSKGDNLSHGGVFESNVKLVTYTKAPSKMVRGAFVDVNERGYAIDYKWDTRISKDNFSLELSSIGEEAVPSAPPVMTEKEFDEMIEDTDVDEYTYEQYTKDIANIDADSAQISNNVSCVIKGSVALDKTKNIVDINFKEITADLMGVSMDFDMSLRFEPVDPAEIKIDSKVDLSKLSEKELEDLFTKIQDTIITE